MVFGVSTHVFLQQRLTTGLLDALRVDGTTNRIQTIEVFAARHHFDYGDRSAVRELGDWFRTNNVTAALHQPLYTDAQWSRHVAPTVNLIDVEKMRRIDAMDETKRAIESAEQVPFTTITLHLGQKDDLWSQRSLEHSLTAIEHLKAFAHPLGVKILLENLQNDVTTPEHLLEIVRVGHFDTVGITLDLGHAHLSDQAGNKGLDSAFDQLGRRIAQLDLSDNYGTRDEHLWPGTGNIDWPNVARHMATLKPDTAAILEIGHDLGETADSARNKITSFFDRQARGLEALEHSPTCNHH